MTAKALALPVDPSPDAEGGATKLTTLALFERLPLSVRRKLNFGDLTSLTGAVLIQDRIHHCFHEQAMQATALRRFKRAHGYCGGELSCLAFVGKGGLTSMCSPCRSLAKERREGVSQYKRQPSEYGKIRARQRALDKAEKERLGR